MSPEDPDVLDDRIRFYLRNRADIDEWARIRDDARAVFNQFMRTLGPHIEERLEDGVRVGFHDNLPRWVCWREGWPVIDTEHNRNPVISVPLEWTARVIPDDPAQAPYLGVLVLLDHPDGQALRSTFRDQVLDVRERGGWHHTRQWPVWRRVIAEGAYWDDLDGYRKRLLDDLATAWATFSPVIQKAVDTTSPA